MIHSSCYSEKRKWFVNEYWFSSALIWLRSVKFATAAWTTPSGTQENNVVFFPVSPRGLVGAFFPINGIPEMPKPSAMPKPTMAMNQMNHFNLPPAVLSHMQQFSPEQRTTIMAQLMHARQQQQQVCVKCSSAIWTINMVFRVNSPPITMARLTLKCKVTQIWVPLWGQSAIQVLTE